MAHGFHRLSGVIITAAFERLMSQMKTKFKEIMNKKEMLHGQWVENLKQEDPSVRCAPDGGVLVL